MIERFRQHSAAMTRRCSSFACRSRPARLDAVAVGAEDFKQRCGHDRGLRTNWGWFAPSSASSTSLGRKSEARSTVPIRLLCNSVRAVRRRQIIGLRISRPREPEPPRRRVNFLASRKCCARPRSRRDAEMDQQEVARQHGPRWPASTSSTKCLLHPPPCGRTASR